MGITLDQELAEQMTRNQFETDLKANPGMNDFYYKIKFGGREFQIRWSKDIGVSNPKWHTIITEA